MSSNALADQLHGARAILGSHRIGNAIARTAVFNVVAAAAGSLGGLIIARAVGPAVRGEYAAVTSWFGVLLVIGEVGQSAAVCFYVARHPHQARAYVATSRAILLVSGSVTLAVGLAGASVLAHGNADLAGAYRLAFGGSAFTFVGTSYAFSLQAASTRRWNLVRVSQPVLALSGIVGLQMLRLLTLETAVGAMIAATAVQLGYAYYFCRRSELAPGRARADLVRPLASYGLAQIAAITPTVMNVYLSLLVLSQLVSPTALGCYAVALSLIMVPVPLVSAIGYVAFPRLAARSGVSADDHRMKRVAVAVSAAVSCAVLLPVAAIAYWLIPGVFGPAYREAIPLLWTLTPGGIFLACGQVVGDLLRGLGRPGLVAIAQGLAAVATVILLVALLPSVGVAAAAIASSVAYGIALAMLIRWLWRPPRPSEARHRRPRTA